MGVRQDARVAACEPRRKRSPHPHARVHPVPGKIGGHGRLKALAEAPRLMHLATHGFYQSSSGSVERPLVLSGLALAGVNQA